MTAGKPDSHARGAQTSGLSVPPRVRTGLTDPHQWRLWLSGLIGARYDGLAHFHVVEPGVLMRCGQPRIRDLEQIRAAHGLSTVVCARGGTRHPLRGRWFRKERVWCAQTGVQLEHLPFSDAATPPADVFARFLEIMQQPQRRPVLVHCEQGFHRTGLLCAAYRIRLCNWPLDRALDEMRAYGFDFARPKRRPLLDALLAWA
jgi:protein tyrosine/serine phosphatase